MPTHRHRVTKVEVSRSPDDTRCQVTRTCGHVAELVRPHQGPWPKVGSVSKCLTCYLNAAEAQVRNQRAAGELYPVILMPSDPFVILTTGKSGA
jgi:hypothetical protein